MVLTKSQKEFLASMLGIDNFVPKLMSAYELWELREKLIDLECDEALEDEQRDEAANLVDYISIVMPEEWRRKTQPEVEAILNKKQVSTLQQKVAAAV